MIPFNLFFLYLSLQPSESSVDWFHLLQYIYFSVIFSFESLYFKINFTLIKHLLLKLDGYILFVISGIFHFKLCLFHSILNLFQFLHLTCQFGFNFINLGLILLSLFLGILLILNYSCNLSLQFLLLILEEFLSLSWSFVLLNEFFSHQK